MNAHVVPVRTYVGILAVLLVLTVATTEIAKIDLGPLNSAVAMLIAGAKTAFVVLFFMHMKWSDYRTRVVAAGGLLWLAIMIGLVLSDYFTRAWLPQPTGW